MTPELEAEIKRLYKPLTFGYKRVAEQVGVSGTTVRRVILPEYNERQRIQSRDAKRRRHGTCVTCGAQTNYGGKKHYPVGMYCQSCAGRLGGLANREKNGVYYHRLVEVLGRHGEMRYSELRDATGISSQYMGEFVKRHVRYGTIVRIRRGVYALAPTAPTLTERVQALDA